MTIVKRGTKGSALTQAELDGNFDDLVTADTTETAARIAADNAEVTARNTAIATAKSEAIATSATYTDARVAGSEIGQGNYDASSNAFPTSVNVLFPVSGGAIKAGYKWRIIVAGTPVGFQPLNINDELRALIDNPTTAAHWAALEGNIGYVPLNASEKGAVNGVGTLNGSGKQPMGEAAVLAATTPVNTPVAAGMTPQQAAESLQGQFNALAASAGIVLNTETYIYKTAFNALGTPLTTNEILALDSFISNMKSKNIWGQIVQFCPSAVANGLLAQAFLDLKTGTSMTGTNMVDGDVVKGIGFKLPTNTTSKFVDTGIACDAYSTSLAWGMGVITTDFAPNSYLFANNPASGTALWGLTNNKFGQLNGAVSFGPVFQKMIITYAFESSTKFNCCLNGTIAQSYVGTAQTAINMSTNFTLFKGTSGGTTTFSKGEISGHILTKALTAQQNLDLNQALVALYSALGVTKDIGGPILAAAGDSNEAGKGVTLPVKKASRLIATSLGGVELNFAIDGSMASQKHGVADVSLSEKLPSILALCELKGIKTITVHFGTNDANIYDNASTAVADGTKLAAFQASYTASLTSLVAAGLRVIVNFIPWSDPAVYAQAAKINSYNAAILAAAKAAKVFAVLDLYSMTADTGLSDAAIKTAYFPVDGVHGNDLWHENKAAKVLAALNGRLYRQPIVSFGSITAGTTATVTTTIPYVKINDNAGNPTVVSISVGLPTPIQGVLIYARVTADDTVTIYCENNTAGAVVLNNIKISVTIFNDK